MQLTFYSRINSTKLPDYDAGDISEIRSISHRERVRSRVRVDQCTLSVILVGDAGILPLYVQVAII